MPGRVRCTESPGEVTLLLNELKLGNKDALGRLIPLVYRELRRLAGRYLQAERAGHTLQPTALVHEAYLRLVEQDRADWQNRAHFLGGRRAAHAPHPGGLRARPWSGQARWNGRPHRNEV